MVALTLVAIMNTINSKKERAMVTTRSMSNSNNNNSSGNNTDDGIEESDDVWNLSKEAIEEYLETFYEFDYKDGVADLYEECFKEHREICEAVHRVRVSSGDSVDYSTDRSINSNDSRNGNDDDSNDFGSLPELGDMVSWLKCNSSVEYRGFIEEMYEEKKRGEDE